MVSCRFTVKYGFTPEEDASGSSSPPASMRGRARDGFDGTLRLNLALTPHHISRQLATNVLIHLLAPLYFFEGCPSTIKTDRSEERGGGEEKNVPLD